MIVELSTLYTAAYGVVNLGEISMRSCWPGRRTRRICPARWRSNFRVAEVR